MSDYIWQCLMLLIPSLLAMIFGIIRVFPKTNGLYFRMGTIGMACLFAGYLSSLTTYLTGISSDGIANVSVLGSIGFSLFLITQNADSVSSVMYKQVKEDSKCVILAIAAPVIIFAVFIIFEVRTYESTYDHGFSYWFGTVGLIGFSALLNAVTAFHTLRYCLAPDEEYGMVSCLRPYNAALTILLVLLVPEIFIREITAVTIPGKIVIVIYYVLLAAGILAVVPLMERGRSKFLASL